MRKTTYWGIQVLKENDIDQSIKKYSYEEYKLWGIPVLRNTILTLKIDETSIEEKNNTPRIEEYKDEESRKASTCTCIEEHKYWGTQYRPKILRNASNDEYKYWRKTM